MDRRPIEALASPRAADRAADDHPAVDARENE
jgi:hypothetical protein